MPRSPDWARSRRRLPSVRDRSQTASLMRRGRNRGFTGFSEPTVDAQLPQVKANPVTLRADEGCPPRWVVERRRARGRARRARPEIRRMQIPFAKNAVRRAPADALRSQRREFVASSAPAARR